MKETEESVKNFCIVRIMLIGYTSEEQFDYDYRVLSDIMEELGGIERRTKPSDESWFKNADSAGMWLMTGSYVSVDYIMDSYTQAFSNPNRRLNLILHALTLSDGTTPLFNMNTSSENISETKTPSWSSCLRKNIRSRTRCASSRIG